MHEATYQVRRLFHAMSSPGAYLYLSQPVCQAPTAPMPEMVFVQGHLPVRPEDIEGVRSITAGDLGNRVLFAGMADLQQDATWYLTEAPKHFLMRGTQRPALTLLTYRRNGETQAALVLQTPAEIAQATDTLTQARRAHRAATPKRGLARNPA